MASMVKRPVSVRRPALTPRRRGGKTPPAQQPSTAQSPPPEKGKKKAGVAGARRLWMRLDGRSGASEVLECDKSTIIRRVSIPPRDFRILGPLFSHSSSILAREKAMVLNLEYIKAIVTAEEAFLLDPLRQQVLPFVDRLRQQFSQKEITDSNLHEAVTTCVQDTEMKNDQQLPFEFQVLEIALENVCAYIDDCVTSLEKEAWPLLDGLTKKITTDNLDNVRDLKTSLTCLLARVQKVRDEIEHLLDDDEDMAQLYLTRKLIQNRQHNAVIETITSDTIAPSLPKVPQSTKTRSDSLSTGNLNDDVDDDGVEDLEMLLEAYFMQLEGMRNKIVSVREYVNDTEDYVNFQLDNQRNRLIQLQLLIAIVLVSVALETFIAGIFAMNIPCSWFEPEDNNIKFGPFIAVMTALCAVFCMLMLDYARRKQLLG